MVRRARYRDEYPLGYHMSNHIRSQAYVEEKSLENYMALYIAIVKDVTSDKALELMGVKAIKGLQEKNNRCKNPDYRRSSLHSYPCMWSFAKGRMQNFPCKCRDR